MTTAAVGGDIMNLADLAKLTGADGSILRITEYMTQMNPFLQDVHWQQGNLTTGHRIAGRTALPSVEWRALNEGVARSRSAESTVDEACGLLEGRSEVDVKLLELNGGREYRMKKDMAFTAAFANELEDAFFNSSVAATPKKIQGLSPRLDDLNGDWYNQIVESLVTGTGNAFSCWFIGWGQDKVYGIVPKGTQAGLTMTDMGQQLITDASSNQYVGEVTVFNQWAGLCVEDYRYICRVANSDSGDIVRTGTLLIQSLIDGYHAIHDPKQCNLVLYMPRLAARFLHHQALQGTLAGTLTIDTLENGRPVTRFLGVPIRISDALSIAETEITT